jgi:cellobiose phosphorylase
MEYFKTKYGHFTGEGDYVITDPRTPAPWVNVLTNGRYGAIYSQTGSGYSFYVDASQSLLTRWAQDLVRDDQGKYFYLRDEDSGELYSPTFHPLKREGEYSCRFAPGRVVFDARFERFAVRMEVVVPPEEDGEVINLTIFNQSSAPLNLSIFSYFELNLGTTGDVHREFHKLFFETQFREEADAILSKKHLWVSWNEEYPYVLVHSATGGVVSFDTDKQSFLGMYGDIARPAALLRGKCSRSAGRHLDPVNVLHVKVNVVAGEKADCRFVIGVARDEEGALALAKRLADADFTEIGRRTVSWWRRLLGRFTVALPEKDLELLLNTWLPYQAVGGRLMARTAYYQTGGAFGFRDQLQDSMAALWLDPSITRRQLLLHAAHQRQDGTVEHWWLPMTGHSPSGRWSDDLLWLPFVMCEYLEHTNDLSILEESVGFSDGDSATMKEHALRSVRSVLGARSERGIPLILDGDWNDGLNGLGSGKKGESFWLSEFLYFVLTRLQELFPLDEGELRLISAGAEELKADFAQHAWNGAWFDRATRDDGEVLGGRADDRIFLNAQTWAVISGITEPRRAESAIEQVKARLLSPYGPLLFSPPLGEPDAKIGYLSRYSPGSRENGGVYTHAAVWTLWAAWQTRDAELADRTYESISPILRSTASPDAYVAEPYVTPGNVDGPLSARAGRAGWTWYSGSAGWLYRSLISYYLGVKPVSDGILLAPCTNKRWKEARLSFTLRGGNYHLLISNPDARPLSDTPKILLDGCPVEGNLLPYREGDHDIVVSY